MPYINTRDELVNFVNNIPAAETAKIAIVRPTTHFAILTPDNPDMVRTLQWKEEYVKSELEKLTTPLGAEQTHQKIKELECNFQRLLAQAAFEEQRMLLASMQQHGIISQEVIEDKGKLETSEFDYFTDQIFVTDTGQYYDNNGSLEFIPANFKNEQRKGEERLAEMQAHNINATVRPLFSQNGKRLIFEGGDIRQMPGKKLFFIGQGHRNDEETGKAIADLSNYYVIPIKLMQAQFYHLDCCFLPLPNDAAVIYEGEYVVDDVGEKVFDANGIPILIAGTETMAAESRELIRTIYNPDKLILLNKNEAFAFATNAAILQNIENNRFKMFVNGDRSKPITDETHAIIEQTISLTTQHIEEIMRVTNYQMDIVEIPYKTMHGSGGSVRCTVQEVACTTSALSPYKNKPLYFSQRADCVENQIMRNALKQDNFLFKSVKHSRQWAKDDACKVDVSQRSKPLCQS